MSLDGVTSGLKRACLENGQSVAAQSPGLNPVHKNVLALVFAKLTIQEIGRCARVCREWRVASNDNTLWKTIMKKTGHTLGADAWKAAGGQVPEEPPFMCNGQPVPWKNAFKISFYWATCPENKFKRWIETAEIDVLIPSMINGRRTTPNLLLDLFAKAPKPVGCTSIPTDFLLTYGDVPIEKSYWIRS